MSINVSNQAEINTLQALLDRWEGLDLNMRLYKTDLGPLDEDTVFADFVEADIAGYSPQTPSITVPATDPSGNAYVVIGEVTFTASSGTPQNIYGWFVADVNDKYYFGEAFPSARPLSSSAPIKFTVIYRLRQIPDA
jgi:hypothetical protein